MLVVIGDRSPFPYQGPLDPREVTGRDELQRDLAERISSRRLTALLGPRRYGKTSLLRRVTADLADVGPDTVWIDLYELNSMADLAGALDRGLDKVTGKARKAVRSIAGSLSLQLGVVGVALARSPRDRPDAVLTVRSLVDVLVRTSEHHDLIVVFDEFSGIARVDGAAGILRTGLQHHYRDIGIVFAGSQPSTMRMLFSDQAQPFFAQADLIEIGPLGDEAVLEIVHQGFESTGRDAGRVDTRLVAFAEGHPQRAMQLADALWRATDEAGSADELTWSGALDAVRRDVDSGSERLYALLPAGSQQVLRALASGGSLYGAAASSLGLAPGTARSAADVLLGNGYLTRREDRLTMVDPLFADWIRRRFPT